MASIETSRPIANAVLNHKVMSPSTRVPTAFHVVALVWGNEYIDPFLELSLPSLLAPGNIPSLGAVAPVVFKFFTQAADVPRLTADPTVEALRKVAEVRFETVDNLIKSDKYAVMRTCHREALQDAYLVRAAVVFVVPDAVQSDGSFATVAKVVQAGKRVVMVPSLRVVKESAAAQLRRRYMPTPGEPVVASARELVRLGMSHMHPDCRTRFWDRKDFTPNPVTVQWKVNNDGFILRGFHLHPLLSFPTHPSVHALSTLDDDLLLLACPDYNLFHVVEDSDDGFFVDLSPLPQESLAPVDAKFRKKHHGYVSDAYWHPQKTKDRPNTVWRMARMSPEFTNLHHRRLFLHPMRVHAREISGRDIDAYHRVKEQSEAVALGVWIFLTLKRGRGAFRRTIFSGISQRSVLRHSIERGLSWELFDKQAPWWLGLGLLRRLGRKRLVSRLARARRTAFIEQSATVFGLRVAERGLRFRRRLRKYWHRKIYYRYPVGFGSHALPRSLHKALWFLVYYGFRIVWNTTFDSKNSWRSVAKRVNRWRRRHQRRYGHKIEQHQKAFSRAVKWNRKTLAHHRRGTLVEIRGGSRQLVRRVERVFRRISKVTEKWLRPVKKGMKTLRWVIGTSRRMLMGERTRGSGS